MSSLWNLPIEKVFCFLSFNDRLELSLANKLLSSIVKRSLTPTFDNDIAYATYRSRMLRPPKNKKSLWMTTISSSTYIQFEFPIYSLPSALKSQPYHFESSDDHFSTFSNPFNDKLVVHKSLIETIEPPEQNLSFLTDSNEMNADIDFTNQAMLLKRQKMILEKVSKQKAEGQEYQREMALRHLRSWGEVVIILCHGGNFNIAGFGSNGKLTESHSDHKYVSRKKQGGRQSAADKHSGGIHSMGASIRRENEKKHAENIEGIIGQAQGMLERASLIFLHAPGLNYYTFIAEKGCLAKWKEKVRSVGMTTTKAKFQETERVYKEISTCRVMIKV